MTAIERFVDEEKKAADNEIGRRLEKDLYSRQNIIIVSKSRIQIQIVMSSHANHMR
jgi:hypothetical protein